MKLILVTVAMAMFLSWALPMEPAMAQGQPGFNPIAAARYSIVIDGIEIASFPSLDAITTGGQTVAGTTAPDRGSVTLHRGVTGGLEMWNWHNAVAGGATRLRKNATLVAYSADGTPVMRFFLESAWASKVEIGGPQQDGSPQVLTETVTLTCTRIDRAPLN